MDPQKTFRLIAYVLTWVIWAAILLGIAMLLAFAYTPTSDSNKWLPDFTWIVTLAVLLVIPLSLRFLLLPRLENAWLVFLVFIIGISFAEMIAVVGIFALRQGQQSYILIGIATILLYCPRWFLSRKAANNP